MRFLQLRPETPGETGSSLPWADYIRRSIWMVKPAFTYIELTRCSEVRMSLPRIVPSTRLTILRLRFLLVLASDVQRSTLCSSCKTNSSSSLISYTSLQTAIISHHGRGQPLGIHWRKDFAYEFEQCARRGVGLQRAWLGDGQYSRSVQISSLGNIAICS